MGPAESLDAFAAERHDPRRVSWADELPDDVKAAIVATNHSVDTIVEWLLAEGYEGATYSKVDVWRRKHRRRGQS